MASTRTRKPATSGQDKPGQPGTTDELAKPALRQQPATSAAKAPATKEQQDRLEELYASRDYPVEKQKPVTDYSKLGAARMISLLESRPLKEETATKPPRTRKPPTEAKAGTTKPAPATVTTVTTAQGKRAVAMRGKLVDGKPTSWLKIGKALWPELAATSPKAAAGRARTAYKLIRGSGAGTGPMDY